MMQIRPDCVPLYRSVRSVGVRLGALPFGGLLELMSCGTEERNPPSTPERGGGDQDSPSRVADYVKISHGLPELSVGLQDPFRSVEM